MKQPIEQMMDAVDWKPCEAPGTDPGIPYATHKGEMHIAGLRLRCYRLNTGQAIIDADDVNNFFGGLIK